MKLGDKVRERVLLKYSICNAASQKDKGCRQIMEIKLMKEHQSKKKT